MVILVPMIAVATFAVIVMLNTNQHAVRINRNNHDPQSSLLIGHINPNDTIKISCASKYSIPVQNRLFDP